LSLCNNSINEIESRVLNGNFQTEEVTYVLDHIRYPKLIFDLNLKNKKIEIEIECRIRINTCFEEKNQRDKIHHSKIWVIFANINEGDFSSEELNLLYIWSDNFTFMSTFLDFSGSDYARFWSIISK
jgi:hypothetical protein